VFLLYLFIIIIIIIIYLYFFFMKPFSSVGVVGPFRFVCLFFKEDVIFFLAEALSECFFWLERHDSCVPYK
jgi:hypothetical protein